MPGRPPFRRVTPLREIGLRLLRPRGNHMTTTDNPQAGIVWASCAPQAIKPERPEEPKQPEWIFISAITVVRVPNYMQFSNPCG